MVSAAIQSVVLTCWAWPMWHLISGIRIPRPPLTGRHVGGLGLFGAKEASALALSVFAMQLPNPVRELIAFETLNARVVEPAALHISYKPLQVFRVVVALWAIPATHYQKTAICLSVVHPAETFRGIVHGFGPR